MTSKLGGFLTGLLLIAGGYLIASQGFAGAVLLAIILGLPWSFLLIFFLGLSGVELNEVFMVPFLATLPILNAAIIYGIGKQFGKTERSSRRNAWIATLFIAIALAACAVIIWYIRSHTIVENGREPIMPKGIQLTPIAF